MAKFSDIATLTGKSIWEINLTDWAKYMSLETKFLFLKERKEKILKLAASILFLNGEDIYLLDSFKSQMG